MPIRLWKQKTMHQNKAEEKEIQYTLLEKAIEELNEDQRKCIEVVLS
jgi:hypothetical protein